MNHRKRLLLLARSFPTLAEVPGVAGERAEVDLDALIEWARGPAPCQAARDAAAFLLNVWREGLSQTELGRPFSVTLAVANWDDAHRKAFSDWAANPWLA